MSEWESIETAPKDETRVLLYRKGWAENTGVGRWSTNGKQWVSVPGDWAWKATHWMPLPEPPNA